VSLEMLKTVCAAEENVLRAKLHAQDKARESIDEVHRVGRGDVASTLARAEAEIAHLMRATDQKATEEAKELASTTANKLATMRARAERRLDDAAQLIVERIVNN